MAMEEGGRGESVNLHKIRRVGERVYKQNNIIIR